MGREKMNQKTLAKLTGIRPATISNMYYEDTKRIEIDQINSLCKVFHCTVGELLEELTTKKPEWETKLIECSKKGLELEPASIHRDFTPLQTNFPDLAKPLSTLSAKCLSLEGILTVILLQIIILLTWVSVCVDPNKGAKGLGLNRPGFATWNPDRH